MICLSNASNLVTEKLLTDLTHSQIINNLRDDIQTLLFVSNWLHCFAEHRYFVCNFNGEIVKNIIYSSRRQKKSFHLQADFYPGYAILVLAGFQIILPCLTGNFLEIEGDKYFTHLSNINWHLMSQADKKSFTILVLFSLFPKKITMFLKNLNLQTFAEVRNLS